MRQYKGENISTPKLCFYINLIYISNSYYLACEVLNKAASENPNPTNNNDARITSSPLPWQASQRTAPKGARLSLRRTFQLLQDHSKFLPDYCLKSGNTGCGLCSARSRGAPVK